MEGCILTDEHHIFVGNPDKILDKTSRRPSWEKPLFHQSTVHVEVLQAQTSTLPSSRIIELVEQMLPEMENVFEAFAVKEFSNHELKEHVVKVTFCDFINSGPGLRKGLPLKELERLYHVYQLNYDGPASEDLENGDPAAATYWILPSSNFEGLWESLVFSTDIQSQLLNFVSTTLLFSDSEVDQNIITGNRVVLLHGPPGTGKTSLCKALAQKLSIRLNKRYSSGQLLEINSHSLFSKWFSESGKLVMKMFQKIQDLIDDPSSLVFILIDEVESLAHARKASMGGTDPSDAIRVVNALLTQLDQMRRYPNVIILTTSNVTGAIDVAFVDRADIKQYVGLPSVRAIYQIYKSCIEELERVNIIYPSVSFFPIGDICLTSGVSHALVQPSLQLQKIALKSRGLSGRTLRKLPIVAHALFLQSSQVTVDNFLEALSKAVDKQFSDEEEFAGDEHC